LVFLGGNSVCREVPTRRLQRRAQRGRTRDGRRYDYTETEPYPFYTHVPSSKVPLPPHLIHLHFGYSKQMACVGVTQRKASEKSLHGEQVDNHQPGRCQSRRAHRLFSSRSIPRIGVNKQGPPELEPPPKLGLIHGE
jgi:hypothetical protein